jgi:hypothetical protein
MVSVPLIATVVATAFALPGALRLGDQTLVAASCATRQTLGLSHYTATLYVRGGESAPLALLDPNRAKALEIGLLSKAFMPPEMPRKYRRALESVLDEATMTQVRAAYRELRPGDSVTLAYLPQRGVSVRVNGTVVAAAPDHQVVESVLAAWANGKPIDQHLRSTLVKHPCPHSTTG